MSFERQLLIAVGCSVGAILLIAIVLLVRIRRKQKVYRAKQELENNFRGAIELGRVNQSTHDRKIAEDTCNATEDVVKKSLSKEQAFNVVQLKEAEDEDDSHYSPCQEAKAHYATCNSSNTSMKEGNGPENIVAGQQVLDDVTSIVNDPEIVVKADLENADEDGKSLGKLCSSMEPFNDACVESDQKVINSRPELAPLSTIPPEGEDDLKSAIINPSYEENEENYEFWI